MNIIILGRGAWGNAIGGVVQRLKHQVTLVSHAEKSWPEIKPDYVLISLPSQHVRETLTRFPSPGVPVLSLCKGLEISTGERVSQIITEAWDEPRVGALSGPTFASEIAAGLPAICTIASESDQVAKGFQAILHQPTFRTYSSDDLIGVNAGARAETFAGLSGIGDLMLTATSVQSRNFRFGQMLAQGLKVEEILPQLGGVCEGLPTTRSVYLNSAIPADSKPIVTQLHAVLYEGMPIDKAVKNLLGRAARDE